MGEASIIDMVLQTLPAMTEAAAKPLANVDSITMYGEGNGNKLVGDVMKTTNQVMEGLKANGIDIKDIIPETLELRSQEGVYVTVEIIDIDGECGGYNLQWAWSSAYVASTALAMHIK